MQNKNGDINVGQLLRISNRRQGSTELGAGPPECVARVAARGHTVKLSLGSEKGCWMVQGLKTVVGSGG